MNWKKIAKHILLICVSGAMLFAIWAHRERIKMYGGLTKEVDYKQFTPSTTAVVINNVNLLAPGGTAFIPQQTVYIDQGLIVSIDSVPNHSGEILTIDGKDKFLIPGLIDSHVHLYKSPNDLLLYVANGVTQIREMVGEKDHLKWRQQIKDGRTGPQMYIASPRFGTFGTLKGWFMTWTQGYVNVQNARQAERAVEKFHRQGYDGLKIYNQMSKACYRAVNERAQSLDMDVVGHIPWSVGLSGLWDSAQSEIAHIEVLMIALNREFGYFNAENSEAFLAFVEERADEIADNLIKNDIAVTSTLYGPANLVRQKFELDSLLKEIKLQYVNPGLSEGNPLAFWATGWLPEVNRYQIPDNLTPKDIAERKKYWEAYTDACKLLASNLIKSGVKIFAGTDANTPLSVPGFSLHDELEILVQAGMSPSQALQAATASPADWLNTKTGKIVQGYEANMVLLDENPLHAIANTRTINTVILKGRVFDRSLLDQMLAAVKEANDSSRDKDISRYLISK